MTTFGYGQVKETAIRGHTTSIHERSRYVAVTLRRDGSLGSTIPAELLDYYGNRLGVEIPLLFTVPMNMVDGDFNDDSLYDCLDINALVAEIAAGTHDLSFDLTGDGLVNLADRDAWLAEAGAINLGPGRAYRVGDANLDGVVDGQDFIRWNAYKFSSTTAWCDGNFNGDFFVDGHDFILWNANKFTSSDVDMTKLPSGWMTPMAGCPCAG